MFLYNTSIIIFGFAIRVVSLFSTKAKLWLSGRRGQFNKLKADVKKDGKVVWFHCASLGEFEQGRPLLELFKQKYPQYKILLTFFSPSGYENKKNYSGADYVYYLPLDTFKNAKEFIDIVQPDIVYFVKYEYWFNYLSILKKREIPVYLISAIFRENQLFFKRYGKSYRRVLHLFKHIFVQDDKSKILLKSIGVTNTSVSGDTRFDRVAEIASQAKDAVVIKNFISNSFVLVAGSTWQPDEVLLHKYINEKELNIKLILAPHEVDIVNIERIGKLFGNKLIKYSQVKDIISEEKNVLLIDNIGLLSTLYKYATITYVGGGFKTGLHNVLEPAAYGKPIIFGPNYSRFREAIGLIKAKAGYSISNYSEFENVLDLLISNMETYKMSSKNSVSYINDNCGATNLILEESAPDAYLD